MSAAEWNTRIGRCVYCGRRGAHRHHCFLEQYVRKAGGDPLDPRNRIDLCFEHHLAHHGPNWSLPSYVISRDCLDFGIEVFGEEYAVELINRWYVDEDGEGYIERLASERRI